MYKVFGLASALRARVDHARPGKAQRHRPTSAEPTHRTVGDDCPRISVERSISSVGTGNGLRARRL